MTRDGLVERNETTGEESRISQRGQDFKLRERLDNGDIRDRSPTSERGGHSQRRPQAPPSQDLRLENTDSRSDDPVSTLTEEYRTSETSAHPSTVDSIPTPREPIGRSDFRSRQHQHGSRYQQHFQADAQNRMDTPVSDGGTPPQDTFSISLAGQISDGLPINASRATGAAADYVGWNYRILFRAGVSYKSLYRSGILGMPYVLHPRGIDRNDPFGR